jgi:hypothetical protein
MPADYEYPPEEWMAPLDRSRFLTMEIDGVEVGEEDFAYRWGGCRPISREDYDLMREQAAWDRENEPVSPLANPTRVLKISDLPEHLRDQAKAERSYWSQKEREYREQAASNWKEIRDAQ